jgi:hypothetical protein
VSERFFNREIENNSRKKCSCSFLAFWRKDRFERMCKWTKSLNRVKTYLIARAYSIHSYLSLVLGLFCQEIARGFQETISYGLLLQQNMSSATLWALVGADITTSR